MKTEKITFENSKAPKKEQKFACRTIELEGSRKITVGIGEDGDRVVIIERPDPCGATCELKFGLSSEASIALAKLLVQSIIENELKDTNNMKTENTETPETDEIIDHLKKMGIRTATYIEYPLAKMERERNAAHQLAESNGKLAHDTAIEALRYRDKLEIAVTTLTKLRDCDWTITLPDRMDAVREIARNAIAEIEAEDNGKQPQSAENSGTERKMQNS